MAKIIDKIVKSQTAPTQTNVLWDDGENLKIYRNGVWKSTNNAEIKEGSIPLSALSSDMNIPSYVDFVKKLSSKDNNTTISIPYANKVVLVRVNDTRILNGGESTVYSMYGMTFTFTASQVSSHIELHIEGNGSLDALSINVYKDIKKIKKEFLPDDIGGADWNAQKGEDGYIENRTHYKYTGPNETPFLKVNNLPTRSSDEPIRVKLMDGGYDDPSYIHLCISLNGNVGDYSTKYEVIWDYWEGGVKPITVTFNSMGDIVYKITPEQTYDEGYSYYITIECIENSGFEYIEYDDFLGFHNIGTQYATLNEKYIPDTIARKSDIPDIPDIPETPNIDSDVWNYMINPCAIPYEVLNVEGEWYVESEYRALLSKIKLNKHLIKNCLVLDYNDGAYYNVHNYTDNYTDTEVTFMKKDNTLITIVIDYDENIVKLKNF